MSVTVEWLGCATFRVGAPGLTLFDTFVDRIEAAGPSGVRSEEIDEADHLFISHTHLDHVLDARPPSVRMAGLEVGVPAALLG